MAIYDYLCRLMQKQSRPPLIIPKGCRNFDDLKKIWLGRVIEAQNELGILTGIPAREAVLDEEHQTRKRFKPI